MIPSMNEKGANAALLEWANHMLARFASDREPTARAKKIEHLYNGAMFSALLEILDPKYNPARLEQSLAASAAGDETRRSMHIIHISLKDFARRLCPKLDLMIKLVDFPMLDREPTRAGLAEVLLLFVFASVFIEDNHPYVLMIQEDLPPKYQQLFHNIIIELTSKHQTLEDNGHAVDSDAPNADADLEHEAAIADLQRDSEEARDRAFNLKCRLDRLQDNYDDLRQKHEELQDENKQLRKQIESEAGNYDRYRLQKTVKENETLIANLENEREALMEEKDRLLKEKTRLEAGARKAELQADENQELRAKNEELSKKANMVDHFKKKVEQSKHLEAEVKHLRDSNLDHNQTYEHLTKATAKIEQLRRENEAYASRMEGYEIDFSTLRQQKETLTFDNSELARRVVELEQRGQRDEGVVQDLQEKILMLDPSAVMDEPLAGGPQQSLSLEDELNETTNNTAMLRSLEVQRLQAENAMLKSTIGQETDKGQLVQEMEDLRASRQALQDKYNDTFERFTVGQKQLDLMIANMSGKGDEAYSNLRTQVLAEQGRSQQLEKQLEAVKEQLADKDRALLEARGDLAAVEASSVDALMELKNTDGLIAGSLRVELEAERKKFKLLKDESEGMQKQLLAAYIEKDELRREAEQANRELQKAADGQTVSTDFIKQSEKMEKLRARYKQLQQQAETSDVKNRELERSLKTARAGAAASVQKAQTEHIIKNLQRENAMIASAWYDLSSRLQSNHFVLQRRNDNPKSWLNKQRNLVNATPRR